MIIYKVTNLKNNMVYIGQTRKSLYERKYYHYKNNKKTKFSIALKTFTDEDFKWEIIDFCNNNCELNNKEKYYISLYESNINGYNSTNGGGGGSTRNGHKNSKEHCEKISESLKNHNVTEKTKQKISETIKNNFIKNPPFNKDEIEDILNKYKNGDSIRKISRGYNTNNHKIKRIITYFLI